MKILREHVVRQAKSFEIHLISLRLKDVAQQFAFQQKWRKQKQKTKSNRQMKKCFHFGKLINYG